jgi:hypothetical protein
MTQVRFRKRSNETVGRLCQTPWRFDDQARRERSSDVNRQQADICNNKEDSAVFHGAFF